MTRTVTWLFVVSVLLFVSGIGFVIAAGRTVRAAAPAEVPAAPTAPNIATVKHVMLAMTMPGARTIWDSVSTIVDKDGIHENQPRTDEEWAVVAANAAVLAESASLLLSEGRAIDRENWAKFSTELRESANKALAFAEKKDVQGILEIGEEINTSCDGCHELYLR
jgi:hypothetical protein